DRCELEESRKADAALNMSVKLNLRHRGNGSALGSESVQVTSTMYAKLHWHTEQELRALPDGEGLKIKIHTNSKIYKIYNNHFPKRGYQIDGKASEGGVRQ